MIINHNPIRRLVPALALLMIFTSCAHYKVCSVRSEGDRSLSGGLLYALPMSELCFDVVFLGRDTSVAPYFDFASEMLAYDPSTPLFVVEDIAISAPLVADPSHCYYVAPGSLSVQVDERHLLTSIGMGYASGTAAGKTSVGALPPDAAAPVSNYEYNLYDRLDTFYRRGDRPGHPSLALSKKDSRSLRQQALSVAEKVGALQDRRQQLAQGEMDESMTPDMLRLQLDQLDRQEQAAIELFVGKSRRETVRFRYRPVDSKNATEEIDLVLFYYSPSIGIADSNCEDAVPVRLNVHCDNEMRTVSRFVRHRTGETVNLDKRNSFKYRIPENARVTLSCPYFQYSEVLPIAQFGPIMELPSGRIRAQFDPQTGALLYVGKDN